MSIYRTAAKIDANQPEIVDGLRAVGALVWIIRQPFDLLVRYQRKWYVLEVKVPKGAYTKEQRADLDKLSLKEGDRKAINTVYSLDDALVAIGAKVSKKDICEKTGTEAMRPMPQIGAGGESSGVPPSAGGTFRQAGTPWDILMRLPSSAGAGCNSCDGEEGFPGKAWIR